MSRRIPIIVALLLVTSCDELGQVSTLTASLTAAPASLVVDPLWAGYPKTLTISVTNTGTAPLGPLDAEVTGEDGPALIEADLHNSAVSPGNSILLDVILSAPAGTSGPASAIVVVDAGADGAIQIPVQANVRTPPSCEDGNPCTSDRFDAEAGLCRHETRDDGSSCDDGSACTTGDACLDGRCLGAAVTCQDDQECTADVCDPSVGCVFEPLPSRCDDEDPCTADVCEPFAGCSNPPLGDGALCHFDGCNEIGLCFLGQCVLSDVPDGVPCEDGDACTANDTCQSGACASGPELGVGAGPPFSFTPSNVSVDLCLGPTTGGDCFNALPEELSVERVLAADVQGSRLRFVWQGMYLDNWGSACNPTDPFYQPLNLDPPEDEAPPPPLEDAGPGEPEGPGAGARPGGLVCAAGVYLTTAELGPTWSGPTTTQLTAVRGPAAAAFPIGADPSDGGGMIEGAEDREDPAEPPPPPPSADVVVVHPDFLRASLWIEERNEDGSLVRSVRRAPGDSTIYFERLAHVAVAADQELITVVAHSDELTIPESFCDAPGCNVLNVPLWVLEQPRFYNVTGVDRVLHLERVLDDSCAETTPGPVPLRVHELSVFATSPQSISLRMSRSACGDVNGAVTNAFTTHRAWRFELGTWSIFPVSVPPLTSPLAIGSEEGSFASFRATADGAFTAVRQVPVDCGCEECLDPSLECACVPIEGTCFDTVVQRSSDPSAAAPEELLRLERSMQGGQAVPLRVEGELRVVTLLGDHVELLGVDDNGVLSRIAAPAPTGFPWERHAPLLPGPPDSMLVVGQGVSVEVNLPTTRAALVQVFGCGLGGGGGGEELCLEEVDCDEGRTCDRSVCLPGPGCEQTGTCDLCWGRCAEVVSAGDAGVSEHDGGDDGGPDDDGGSDGGGAEDGGPSADAGEAG